MSEAFGEQEINFAALLSNELISKCLRKETDGLLIRQI